VNWSAAPITEVPPAVDTVTSTVPDPEGVVAVHEVVETQVAVVPVVPKVAVVPPGTKPMPVMVTTVPPITGPVVGAMPVTPGAGS
jgi:hypothetical protein